jgi:hypothetical protein
MVTEKCKKDVLKWAKSIGEVEARRRMLNAGIGYSTAVLLSSGKYVSELKVSTMDKLKEAMK